VGVALGLAGALAASGAVRGLLYGVGATDPETYAAVIAVLVVVTIAACLLPAWRAARVNPLVALRGD
jgi:ABC-type antimicrobial peptide transport system permease subunit